MPLPSPLPDNPTKWDGWKHYNSDDPYQRLGLTFEDNPSPEQIEDNCRQLLIWWQKKLPLKSQPSNPLSQLLRGGLDEAPKFLAEARTLLLNPLTRKGVDERIRARLKENAASEFYKFLAFALADGVLTKEDEANLYNLGSSAGLTHDEMKPMVDGELSKRNAKRKAEIVVARAQPAGPSPFMPTAQATAPPKIAPGAASNDPRVEFARMLRLTGLDEEDMTDDQRDALCNMGENLGLTGGQAEDVIDEYLEEVSGMPPAPDTTARAMAPGRPVAVVRAPVRPVPQKEKAFQQTVIREISAPFSPLAKDKERQKFPNFTNSAGMEMLLINSGTFMMGSTAVEATPIEQPLSRTNVSCFHMAKFPVTNAQYEQFDPAHRSRRAPWADDNHPVVYVNSVDAIKFCEWLAARDRKKYRLPTEAEWEYAARGTDGRTFPWGEKFNRGDLGNFADANTAFTWRDPEINDGFTESAPVGSFPRGVSPFGIEDMAGNVWEWCLDFFAPYQAQERTNPRSNATSGRRIYRGGSWKSRTASLRTSARNFNVPDYLANDVGFRVVCECE